MNLIRKRTILSALFLFLFFSCGIEEYYYLPKVPESNITSTLTDSARIELPPIDSYYYATNYSIFYRIYISGVTLPTIQTPGDRSSINLGLAADFNTLSRYTDASGSAVTTLNTFRSLNYYEIALDGEKIADIFSKYGGTLEILFPTSQGFYPTVSLNNGNAIRLRRSGELTSPEPSGDPFFRNTDGLNDNDNATALKNADVAGRAGIAQRFTYVSMYIVARGYNNDNFSQIYGKPTHINIFKLPDIN